MKVHGIELSGCKVYLCKEGSCDFKTAQPVIMFQHMNYKEKKSKISVQCEICGVTKPSHNYMNVHMDKVHGVKMGNKKDRKIFKCDEEGCTFETFYPGAMYDHKKRHRIPLEKRKTFSCEHCGVK